MMIDNCYVVMPETAEEIKLANEAILKLREAKQKQELIQKVKTSISFEVSNAINTIGLEETKRIMRELTKGLRNLG